MVIQTECKFLITVEICTSRRSAVGQILVCLIFFVSFMWINLELFTMSDEDRMRSEIQRMQMRGDELTDQVDKCNVMIPRLLAIIIYYVTEEMTSL